MSDSVKIQFLASRRGPGYRFSLGQVVDVEADLAKQFIAEKAAIIYVEPAPPRQIGRRNSPGVVTPDEHEAPAAQPVKPGGTARKGVIADRKPAEKTPDSSP
jgi:hypothetical protein